MAIACMNYLFMEPSAMNSVQRYGIEHSVMRYNMEIHATILHLVGPQIMVHSAVTVLVLVHAVDDASVCQQ
jgi:hypothetical protein